MANQEIRWRVKNPEADVNEFDAKTFTLLSEDVVFDFSREALLVVLKYCSVEQQKDMVLMFLNLCVGLPKAFVHDYVQRKTVL